MKVLVACKRVIDYAVKIRVKPDRTGVEKANVRHSLNPFDEIALEEALRLKERSGLVSEVLAVSLGPTECCETLRTTLALGADSAIHLKTKQQADVQPIDVAKQLYCLIKKDPSIRLVIMGKQAIDDDSNQTGQILSGMLGWSQGSFISNMAMEKDTLQVTREVDEGLQKLNINLPAILTADLRLNTPRYSTLQNIMKSKSKPLRSFPFDEPENYLKINDVKEPDRKQAGLIVDINKIASVLKAL